MTEILCPAVKDGIHRCKLPPNHEGHEHYCSDKCSPWEEDVFVPLPNYRLTIQLETPDGWLHEKNLFTLSAETLPQAIGMLSDSFEDYISTVLDEGRI
jgi:hypothetical protein